MKMDKARRTTSLSRQSPDEQQQRDENIIYLDRGCRRQENRGPCFVPVFKDCDTDIIFPSNFEDGRRAPFHCLDGLPDNAFTKNESPTLKHHVVAGFMRNGIFYTRDEASELLQELGTD